MSLTVQSIFFRVILPFVVACASVALGQTAIDDVHITPREKTVDVDAATYPASVASPERA